MKTKLIVTRVLTVLLALAFLGASFAKLSSSAMMVSEFNGFGYPLWFMYVTGMIELISVVLLLIPRTTAIGAGLIICVMIGALFSHLSHGQVGLAVPPLVLLILAIVVGTLRGWGSARALIARA